MQIVYISNRPEMLLETLKHVAIFMPFVNQAIACVPDSLLNAFQHASTPLPLKLVTESSILDSNEASLLHTLDHQRRNYLLRKRLVDSDIINTEFIMSDDDARPLKPIELELYIQRDKYRRYTFYDLADWDNNQTEFDAGQLSTFAVLNQEGLEHFSYASHMPQIINRDLFREAVDFFRPYSQHHALCEWSSYFNYAGSKYPDRFHAPEPFLTLCWPEHPRAWPLSIKQSEYAFENVTPKLYAKNGVFHSIDSNTSEPEMLKKQSIEKVIRWRSFSIASLHPEQSKSVLKFFNPRTWANKLLH